MMKTIGRIPFHGVRPIVFLDPTYVPIEGNSEIMTQEPTKAIIVDNEEIHAFLSGNFKEWDTQKVVPSLKDLWGGLNDGSLSSESKIIFISDELFETDEDLFAQTVATLAPYALLIVASWNPSLIGRIEEKVASVRVSENLPAGKIYWIQPQVAISQINEAIHHYEYRLANPEAVISQVTETTVQPATSAGSSGVDTSHNGIVVTVTSSKGGSGKSTVASLLAAQVSKSSQKAYEEGKMERPLKVCLVDLDIFDGQLGFLLGMTKPTSLNIALSKDIFGPELVYNNLVYSSRMGFHALLAPMRGVTAFNTDAEFYRKVINLLRTMFDLVILDTSVQHYDALISNVALPDSDVVLLVTTLDIKSIAGMKRWIDTARTPVEKQGHGISMKKVGIVVNQSSNSVSMDEEKLATASAGVQKLVAIPLDTVAVQAAGNNNRLENIIENHAAIGSAYYSLARKLTKNLDFGLPVNLSPLIDDEGIHASRPNGGGNRPPAPAPAAKKKTGWFKK